TPAGLVVRYGKFRRSRLIPLHSTARAGLESYLASRRTLPGDHLFVGPDGRPLRYGAVHVVFARLLRELGAATRRGGPRPGLHSLRHTFAVRALEAAPSDRYEIARHQVAL